MYPTSFSHNFKKGLLIFTAVVLLGLVYPVYQWLVAPSAIVTAPSELNFGLEGDSAVQKEQLAGFLYFYGTPQIPEDILAESSLSEVALPDLVPGYYAYDISTQDIIPVPSVPEDTSIPGLAVLTSEGVSNPANELHPGWIDYEANSLNTFNTPAYWNESPPTAAAINPADRQFVVYEGQIEKPENATDESFFEIAGWDIVIHNPFTEDTRIIKDAARPVWLNGEADIVYLKQDGIYRYNLAADASQRIEARWRNLDRSAQLAIPDDSTALVLTIPNLNSIVVYNFIDSVNGTLELRGTIAQEGVVFTAPVIAPSNRQYAVQAQNESDWDAEANSYTASRVEMRNLFEREITSSIDIGSALAPSSMLLGWHSKLQPVELY